MVLATADWRDRAGQILADAKVKERVENGPRKGGETCEARDLVAGSIIGAFWPDRYWRGRRVAITTNNKYYVFNAVDDA